MKSIGQIMKTITLILIAAAGLLAQDKKSPPPKAAPKDAASLPNIPAGAKEVGDNLYRYTDAQGKTWMYRRTPFGLAKWEDKPSAAQPAVIDEPAPATATDLGDSVQFQRDTPFGPEKWTRKKSELTDDEKAIMARPHRAKQPVSSVPAAKTEVPGKTPARQ